MVYFRLGSLVVDSCAIFFVSNSSSRERLFLSLQGIRGRRGQMDMWQEPHALSCKCPRVKVGRRYLLLGTNIYQMSNLEVDTANVNKKNLFLLASPLFARHDSLSICTNLVFWVLPRTVIVICEVFVGLSGGREVSTGPVSMQMSHRVMGKKCQSPEGRKEEEDR